VSRDVIDRRRGDSAHHGEARRLAAADETSALLGLAGVLCAKAARLLQFQVTGVIKDVERLRQLFDLFAETLDQLCRIGSAYETQAGV
jgi:hypothetical protein